MKKTTIICINSATYANGNSKKFAVFISDAWFLQYAHRRCVQRWCNEKGNTTCEICQQVDTFPIHFNFHQLMTVYSLTAHFYLLATFPSLDLCFISATWSLQFTYSSRWTVWISAIQAWLYSATSPVSVWEYSNELQVTRHFDFSS